MASILLGSPPEEDTAVSLASIAPDPIPEDEGEEIDPDNSGMNENEIKELLGESYKTDPEERF